MANKNLNTYIDSETQSLNSFEKDTYLQNDEEVNNINLLNYDDYIIKTGFEIFKYENVFISSTKLVPNNEYKIYGDPDRWKLDCAQQFYNCGIVSALNVNSIACRSGCA